MQTVSPTSSDKIALTLKEAARVSGLSRTLLYVEIARGTLTARKCGARTVILESELRRFLRSLPRWRPKSAELSGQEGAS
jgi:hypothetical protein